MGSSPLGASGLFWEVFTESIRKYPGYNRKKTPWWEVQAFCLNVKEALRLAPTLETGDRVELFGNDRIKAIYSNMPLEDFQQEYEAAFVDETTAWISWDEIKAITDENLLCHIAVSKGNDISNALMAINALAGDYKKVSVERAFVGGMDIGRTRNTSELFLVGADNRGNYPLRLMITMDGMEYDRQFEIACHAMSNLPIIKVAIDKNGIGSNLAENLEKKFPSKAEGVNFTNTTKQLWAADAKMLTQQKRVRIPKNRDLAYQIHSIKKIVTPSNNLVFDTDRNEKHHADQFWAWALAISHASLIAKMTAGAWGSNRTMVH